jgi:transcription initiation factor TFIIIB Brf1 subunit/transcription initiation factor TFIIB
MFNQNTSADTKIAVLEERLSSFETMMRKIDEAIQIMGKTSQNISKMLAVHEERIEQCNKSDDYIARVIEELRLENKDQHQSVSERIQKVENKIEEFARYRWIIVGVFAVISVGISQSHLVVDLLTPDTQPVTIERAK